MQETIPNLSEQLSEVSTEQGLLALAILAVPIILGIISLRRGLQRKFFIFHNKFDIFISLAPVVLPVCIILLGFVTAIFSGKENGMDALQISENINSVNEINNFLVLAIIIVVPTISIVMSFLANGFSLSSLESIVVKLFLNLILLLGFAFNFISFALCFALAALFFFQKDKRYKSDYKLTKTGMKKGFTLAGTALWCLFLGFKMVSYVVRNFCLPSCKSTAMVAITESVSEDADE